MHIPWKQGLSCCKKGDVQRWGALSEVILSIQVDCDDVQFAEVWKKALNLHVVSGGL